jgi:hypothetical protein
MGCLRDGPAGSLSPDLQTRHGKPFPPLTLHNDEARNAGVLQPLPILKREDNCRHTSYFEYSLEPHFVMPNENTIIAHKMNHMAAKAAKNAYLYLTGRRLTSYEDRQMKFPITELPNLWRDAL